MFSPTNKQLRNFILEFFNEEELHTFCFDYFRDVEHEFGSGMSFNEKVRKLIDYCTWNDVEANLLENLQREKQKQYQTAFAQFQKKRVPPPPVYEPQPRNPRKIFVSHSTEDGKLAQQIAKDLQRHGYDIFITPASIRAGEKWVDAIMRGLDESGVFLVLLTPNAVKSGWVMQETNTAIALNNGNEARLLFLHVEECQPPTLWKQWQYLPFRNKDYKQNFDNLLRELKGEPALPVEIELPDPQPEPGSQPVPKPVIDIEKQEREAQVASLYQQLLQARAKEDWLNVGMLAAQIEVLMPDYRDVAALKVAALSQLQNLQSRSESSPKDASSEPLSEAIAEKTV